MIDTNEQGIAKPLAVAILGTAAFGVAAAAGHGLRAMATGAWAAPLVFFGGAALAMPPLYLFGALAGSRRTGADVLRAVSTVARRVAIALVGLAAPAAFFSVTLKGALAEVLLVATACVVGGAGVVSVVAASTANEEAEAAKIANVLWLVVALALGARLVASVGRAAGVFGGA